MAINGLTNPQDPHYHTELRNRYLFTGNLVMQTALHIGGGQATLSSSDSPVVLTPEQQPYIPGSSFKGALRSTVEKLAAPLPGFSTCALRELSKAELAEHLKAGKKASDLCPTVRQWEVAQRRQATGANVAQIMSETLQELCDTCRLFGSPFAASRVNVSDLPLVGKEWRDVLEIRDGVAINRDSETAKDGRKFDFEVVPATATFAVQIVLENATKKDVQLLCVGLSEFLYADEADPSFGVVGGKRSRGLGAARLDGLRVFALELFSEGANEQPVDEGTRRERLKRYLIGKKISEKFPSPYDGAAFLKAYIESMFTEGGSRPNVAKIGE